MDLILRAHENPADPVWSVIIMVIIALLGTTYYIYYLLNLDSGEMDSEE